MTKCLGERAMIQTHQITMRMGQSIPLEVEAGANVPLKVYVSCTAGCDLRGGGDRNQGFRGGRWREDASASFSFRTDKPPEHRVAVKVVAKDSGAAVGDVEVRLGLYIGWTNQQ